MRQRIRITKTTSGQISTPKKEETPIRPKRIFPRTSLREEPKLVWSSIYGVKTDNGNYLFFRKAQWSRNLFWYNKKKPVEKNGQYYMPPRFHKIMGWVYLAKEQRLAIPQKVVWGNAQTFQLKETRLLNEKTVKLAIDELERLIKRG